VTCRRSVHRSGATPGHRHALTADWRRCQPSSDSEEPGHGELVVAVVTLQWYQQQARHELSLPAAHVTYVSLLSPACSTLHRFGLMERKESFPWGEFCSRGSRRLSVSSECVKSDTPHTVRWRAALASGANQARVVLFASGAGPERGASHEARGDKLAARVQLTPCFGLWYPIACPAARASAGPIRPRFHPPTEVVRR